MLITYIILLLTAIIFKVMHFPGFALIFILSIFITFIDIIIQLISNKANKTTRILSAAGVFFISIHFLFKFLRWPGATIMLIVPFSILTVYFLLCVKNKSAYNLRFYLTGILFVFALFNATMKGSTFQLLYLKEDPFNESELLPDFIIQRLAYDFYNEKKYDKAEFLTRRNIRHLNTLIKNDKDASTAFKEIDQHNLKQSQDDLIQIQQHTWTYFNPLIPEDREQ